MLFGKYVNKYYKKYALLYILGVLFLIAVDWIQLYIPEFTGNIVSILEHGISPDGKKQVLDCVIKILLVAAGMFIGRMGYGLMEVLDWARLEP